MAAVRQVSQALLMRLWRNEILCALTNNCCVDVLYQRAAAEESAAQLFCFTGPAQMSDSGRVVLEQSVLQVARSQAVQVRMQD